MDAIIAEASRYDTGVPTIASLLLDQPTGGASTLERVFLDKPSDALRAGEGLFWEGDLATSVYQVVDGVLRVFRHMVDGRRGISGFLYPGAILGLSFASRYLYSVEAVTDVRVRRFSRERFQRLVIEAPHLHRQFVEAVSDELSEAQDQVLMLSQKCAEERVASFLLFIARKNGPIGAVDVEIDVPMSRLDIADYLGLTVETVCRALTKLHRDNAITLIGRRRIVLRRPSNLKLQAGDCEGR